MVHTIIATPDLLERTFRFELKCEEKRLGPLGKVPFYWMCPHTYRVDSPDSNFRSCVDFYWQAMKVEHARDKYAKANLVFAEIYPYVCKARSQQKIYRDAYLTSMQWCDLRHVREDGKNTEERTWKYEVSEEQEMRLREIARTRDTMQVQKELDKLLLVAQPNYGDHAIYQKIVEEWLRDGIRFFNLKGWTGLWKYAKSFQEIQQKFRKRGGVHRVRDFLNRFQYECKLAFYLCYTNAWIGIIKWLKKNKGLSVYSERLLRTWHAQAQPRENESDTPGGSRDPFFGQILALHPLSIPALGKPEHLQVISRWIGHLSFEELVSKGEEDSASEYWEMVGTILVAAAEYKITKDRWKERYGIHVKRIEKCNGTLPGAIGEKSASEVFNGYAVVKGVCCSKCQKPVEYTRYRPPKKEGGNAEVDYRCTVCHEPRTIEISEEELKKNMH